MAASHLASDFVVASDIRVAETLPAAAFRDRDFLALELGTLFARSWQLVPDPAAVDPSSDPRSIAELCSARGARLPFSLLGRPLFLQRGWDDAALRCFSNACTHAWYPLVAGPSRGPTLVCGQHGRKFDCAGRFVAHAGFSGLPDFPRDCDHLRELEVASWQQLTFVRDRASASASTSSVAPSLDHILTALAASTAQLPLATLRRSRAVAESREVAGNWKQHVWNYMDRYHVGFIHRAPGGLADACDMSSYQTELSEHAALQWVYARRPEDGFDPALLPERFRDPAGRRVFALWWLLLPNLALNFYPWGLSINVFEPIPERPDSTLFRWYHLVLDDALHARREDSWLSSQVDAEDLDAMAQVRRSLREPQLPRGRFAPLEETGPHWFHRQIYRALFEST